MNAWLGPLEVEQERYRLPPTPAQLRGFFGKLRYSGVWIFRFLDFTTDYTGEEELLAEIERNGFIEARPFQLRHRVANTRENEEWGAIGDPSSREEDRRNYSYTHATDTPEQWKRQEKAARDFWRDAAGTSSDKPRLGRCINCGEAATEKWQGDLYCEDCVPEEALDDGEVD